MKLKIMQMKTSSFFDKNSVKLKVLFGLFSLLLLSCGSSSKERSDHTINEANLLLNYLEENGNLINSPAIPALIEAGELYENLKREDLMVIDLRSVDEFNDGHIENSINVEPSKIIDFFENIIEPNSYEKIVLVCNNAFLSAYTHSVLALLGYGNIFTLRYGLSSWNKDIAQKYWLASISSYMEGKLDKTTYAKPAEAELPIINTSKKSPYMILRERAIEILDNGSKNSTIKLSDIEENYNKYFIINYWPESLYEQGHLRGAIQYTPKQSLMKNSYLLTLPVDKPIVLYCYTAHHSSYVTAFLRLLGYEVYNIEYGANSFINETLVKTQTYYRGFQKTHIYDFPLEKKGEKIDNKDDIETDNIVIQGGC